MRKTNILTLIVIVGLSLLVQSVGHSEQTYKSFIDDQYDPKDYKISRSDMEHGEVILRIIQAKKLTNFKESPHYCRSWFTVIKSKQTVFNKFYDDIEPVAFSFGLFVPRVQPPPPYFAVIKNGDYDGRLFLVRKDGEVYDLMGGFYFITEDKRYLFSQYASDMEGLVVFDLETDDIVFSSDKIPYIHQWYVKGGVYFFTESEWLPANHGNATEKGGIAYFYDFNAHQIVKKDITAAEIATAKVLPYDFDPREYEDCITEPNKSLKRDAATTRRSP